MCDLASSKRQPCHNGLAIIGDVFILESEFTRDPKMQIKTTVKYQEQVGGLFFNGGTWCRGWRYQRWWLKAKASKSDKQGFVFHVPC